MIYFCFKLIQLTLLRKYYSIEFNSDKSTIEGPIATGPLSLKQLGCTCRKGYYWLKDLQIRLKLLTKQDKRKNIALPITKVEPVLVNTEEKRINQCNLQTCEHEYTQRSV